MPPTAEFTVTRASYAKGMLAVRCSSKTDFKSRAARLIGDGLKCRWVKREGAYIASPSKVAKFERLHAEGWDANYVTGALEPPSDQHAGSP